MKSLTVALDIRHPFAYLALGPTIEFGRDANVSIDWLPLRAQTLRPPSDAGRDDDRSLRHRRNRAEMIAREIAVYAEAQGLTLNDPYRDGPTTAFELAWLWVHESFPASLEAFLGSAFQRYWACDLDPDDSDQVAGVLASCGLDEATCARWTSAQGTKTAAAVSQRLAGAGISQSPAYLLGHEIFFGRQHLSMIRWRIEGENGPVPI